MLHACLEDTRRSLCISSALRSMENWTSNFVIKENLFGQANNDPLTNAPTYSQLFFVKSDYCDIKTLNLVVIEINVF